MQNIRNIRMFLIVDRSCVKARHCIFVFVVDSFTIFVFVFKPCTAHGKEEILCFAEPVVSEKRTLIGPP